ncbi:MAG: hypothetical protein UR52_C0001G0093 [Candidatus Gottesmanbacteria bacterium GW2011_GWA1_34_13]|uniref:Uncharacterized protein n=1 Tax=Candidatus Gottesmanbacteria bacterium GW2011_GWA1_34_13 TaxID=1618434 RepID=A0A0G0ASF5_9BACT|nr:MAG: hypothetical protein UR52_C0001G0093 [Candidatus Gottesmanbacteria bacterium GW2011_GWA1_34_13]
MQNKTKNILAILFLTIVSLFAMRALIHFGFYTSHDGWHIVTRLYYFDAIVRDGQIPVRFSANLLNGFGYPLFIFSYHLPWIIAEPLMLAGLNVFDAIKAVFILTYIMSGIFMYFWLSQVFGKKAGLLGAFVFLFTPYRFVNIFVRANIGEAVSFMTYPLIFWSIYNLSLKKSFKWVCIGAFGLVGAMLSHIMVIFLFFLPLILYAVHLFFKTKNKIIFIIQISIMVFLSIGVSAYYLFPAIYYKPITVFADTYKQLYANHFTPISKLLYSPWGYGALGTPGEMSRQIGIAIWLINIISIPLIIFQFLKKIDRKTIFVPLICLITFSISLFFLTKISISIWKMGENFALIDFPWRFLAVTTFFGSLLTGWVVFSLRKSKYQIIFMAIFLGLIFYTNRNHVRVNQYTDIPLSLYIDSELTTNTDDEYLPKWVSREYAKKKQPLITNQDITMTNLTRNSKEIIFDINSQKQTELQISQMWFPGWQALVNGEKIDIGKSSFGGMTINVPQGKSHINLEYGSSEIMNIGNILTIISLMVTASGLIFKKFIWKKK